VTRPLHVVGPDVAAAVRALARGRPIVLHDDLAGPGAAEAGVLVVAAERMDTATMAFLVRESSGVVCVAMSGGRLDDLRLPPLAPSHAGPGRVAFAVSVDLRRGIGTGISARDRAATVRALADPVTGHADLVRPGHVLPLRAHDDGVRARPRPAEAAVELCRLAGLVPAAALATVIGPTGDVAGAAELDALADRHGLAAVRVSDLAGRAR
jgi:3,4-dihydroxy-2-butanone 4-phosphate synthase